MKMKEKDSERKTDSGRVGPVFICILKKRMMESPTFMGIQSKKFFFLEGDFET